MAAGPKIVFFRTRWKNERQREREFKGRYAAPLKWVFRHFKTRCESYI